MSAQSRARSPLGIHLMEIYQRLYQRYGPQHWWPGDGPLETIVGAILTQNTAWRNVELALHNLKAANVLDLPRLQELSLEALAQLIRPSGFFNIKARRLKAFVHHLSNHYDNDLAAFLNQAPGYLRKELLSIYGIGEETADDILLYASKSPSFVIDAYTRRILLRLGVVPDRNQYDAYQALFHHNLALDTDLFNEYHALLDRHAQETCQQSPHCRHCCLLDLCPTGSRWMAHQNGSESHSDL